MVEVSRLRGGGGVNGSNMEALILRQFGYTIRNKWRTCFR